LSGQGGKVPLFGRDSEADTQVSNERETIMGKYLWQGRYTQSGMKGVLQEGGNARRNAAEKAIQSAGGQLDSFFFGFGEHDVYCIIDFPDDITCAAAAMTVGAAGGVAIQTTVLLTADDVDRASNVELDYRPPGA
jgi:uncharacterized protein with GYD domain